MQTLETVTVKLLSPIVHDGTTYAELTFREAELGDLCAADHFKGEMQKTAAVLAGMADITVPAIRKLKARDASAIIDRVGHLMGNVTAPTTGDS